MIRFFFDEQGAFSNDLFIKIDATPTKVMVADTTWLSEFFETFDPDPDGIPLDDNQLITAKKDDVTLLINLWIKLLLSDEPVCYLPVGLADQSSRALRFTRAKRLIHVSLAWTTDIVDGTTETYFLTNQATINWNIYPDTQWAIAPKSILTGLNWSLTRLQLPTVPLHYE